MKTRPPASHGDAGEEDQAPDAQNAAFRGH
jgi:hypothetical protein